MSTFYYNMKQLYLLTTLNVVLLLGVICISNFFNDFMWWNAVVTVLCLTALSSSLFVTLFPQKLAIVSSEGIKIDHNELLKWQDIECVEKIKLSRFLGREIIVFKLKDNKSYSLTLMQKISQKSSYGAFSIPLYAMAKNDKEKIEQEIEKYVKIS